MTESAPLVEIRGVVKFFSDGRPILDQVDLVVGEGELVAVEGPSGSGKSTLLHLLGALDRASAGSITVAGHDVSRARGGARYRRSIVGMIFQLHNLLPHLTAAQNVEVVLLGSRLRSRARRDKAHDLLDQVGLADRALSHPPRLSGGERQRVAVARALANDPRLVLADEPTSSLDSVSSVQVIDLLRRRVAAGCTVIAATHDPQVWDAADRRLTLVGGRLHEADGAPTGGAAG